MIDKVPLQGFVLIDAATEYGQRLVTRWRTPNNPQRRVVPASFVEACIKARGIIPPIFTAKNGDPLRIHIHHSIQVELVRDRAHERIWVRLSMTQSPLAHSCTALWWRSYGVCPGR